MPPRQKWPYDLPYTRLDLRAHPHLYRIGVGEQGVLTVQPYKRELLPHWRFSTPDIARQSSQQLERCFEKYRDDGDFVGCDMARKFIQMGVTRARRYANRRGGQKYEKQTAAEKASGKKRKLIPKDTVEDPVKAESARIFGVVLARVKADSLYLEMVNQHKATHERELIPSGKELERLLLPEESDSSVKKEEEVVEFKAEPP